MKHMLSAVVLMIGFFSFAASDLAKASETLEIVPGKSLGPILLGEKREALINKGFAPVGARDPEWYLKKKDLLVHLEGGKVTQIFFDGSSKNFPYKKLRLQGRPLPKKTTEKSLRHFFKKCESSIEGSSDITIYCENRGVELSYSRNLSGKKQFDGLAVVAPEPVENVHEKPPKK